MAVTPRCSKEDHLNWLAIPADGMGLGKVRDFHWSLSDLM